MKSRLLLISALLAATAGLNVSTAVATDAQAQAAALLSSSNVASSEGASVSTQSARGDAQAQAAALLSGARAGQDAPITTPRAAQSLDAQAHAAALLSGSRTTSNEPVRTTAASSDALGDHPAVIAARTWSTRSLDPNTFVVAHPARLELVAASPSEKLAARGTDVQARAGR